MNKKEFYENHIKPYLTNDKPANRQLWNDTLDQLEKEGLITHKQSYGWVYPKNKKFE